MSTELWKLSVPAASLVKGPDFTVLPKRKCEISFYVEGDDGQTARSGLRFDGVEAFKCTYLTSCSAEMFNVAYGKLVRLVGSPLFNEILKTYNGNRPVEELQHLMTCFDDGPCFEIICTDFVELPTVRELR